MRDDKTVGKLPLVTAIHSCCIIRTNVVFVQTRQGAGMEAQYFLEINGEDTDLAKRSRKIWINPQHIVYAEDFDSSPDVCLHLVDGTSIVVSGDSGDITQGYFHKNSVWISNMSFPEENGQQEEWTQDEEASYQEDRIRINPELDF